MIYQGLRIVWEANLSHIICESDLLMAIHLIQHGLLIIIPLLLLFLTYLCIVLLLLGVSFN